MREVRVTGVAEEVYYAQVVLVGGAVVDARPSDAVNLAAVTRTPVYVAPELILTSARRARRGLPR